MKTNNKEIIEYAKKELKKLEEIKPTDPFHKAWIFGEKQALSKLLNNFGVEHSLVKVSQVGGWKFTQEQLDKINEEQ